MVPVLASHSVWGSSVTGDGRAHRNRVCDGKITAECYKKVTQLVFYIVLYPDLVILHILAINLMTLKMHMKDLPSFMSAHVQAISAVG